MALDSVHCTTKRMIQDNSTQLVFSHWEVSSYDNIKLFTIATRRIDLFKSAKVKITIYRKKGGTCIYWL